MMVNGSIIKCQVKVLWNGIMDKCIKESLEMENIMALVSWNILMDLKLVEYGKKVENMGCLIKPILKVYVIMLNGIWVKEPNHWYNLGGEWPKEWRRNKTSVQILNNIDIIYPFIVSITNLIILIYFLY